MSKLVERFIRYASRGTQSNESNECCPSTPGQMALAQEIKGDLEVLGLEEISLDDNGYLFASLPANTSDDVPTIGFIAHLDTAPDSSGDNVKPRIVDYAGGVITLNEEKGIALDPKDFPELDTFVGQQLIVTDGTTLLGADDKAGVAEIIAAVEYLKEHPEIKHGKVRIGFNPDEEIGRGSAKFDVEKFGADWAYTMDGGPLGELQYENFNAATAVIEFTGRVVHPGTAKDKMVNAILVANKFASLLPADEVPARTEGYEGFYHLISCEGSVGKTKLIYILRDHDREKFEHKKAEILRLTDEINKEFPGCAVATVTDSYFNMREKIEPVMHVVDLAKQAMLNVGVQPVVEPIRGGTDGASLSYKGLPCPNIFAGGMNMHGIYEYVSIPTMEKAVQTIVEICRLAAK